MNALAMRINAANKNKQPGRASTARVAKEDQELAARKTMLKGCLAAAAPALVSLVVLVSVDTRGFEAATGLGRMGTLAVGALFLSLSHLLWRRRWWAGLPVTALFASVAAYLGLWVSRPLGAYFAANHISSLGELVPPLVLLSPHLAVGVISLTLAWAVGRAMALAKRLGPAPVSRHVWIVMLVWAAMLAMDLLSR
ncbi:MAG: hypothetical protein V1806_02800 [Pseudomonadota bacterium]